MLRKNEGEIFAAIKNYKTTKSLAEIISLVNWGVDLTVQNADHLTPIQFAMTLKLWECVNIIAGMRDADSEDSEKYGDALLNAVKENQLITVQILINANASMIWHMNRTKNGCLHEAVINNNTEILALLLENKASQTVSNVDEETPVELASRLCHWDCVRMLVEYNSVKTKIKIKIKGINKIDAEDLHYEYALLNAIKAGHYETVKLLLDHKAPCTNRNNELGNIALYWAVISNHPAIAGLLVEYGADPGKQNKEGKTTYTLARELGFIGCLMALNQNNESQYSYDTATLIRNRDVLFDSMMENAASADLLPEKIQTIEKYDHAILKNDLIELSIRREALKNAAHHSTYAILLSGKQNEVDNLRIIITTINTLLNYSDHIIPSEDLNKLNQMCKQGFEQAEHVITVIKRKEMIDAYAMRLRAWLNELNDQVNRVSWKVKNIFGSWGDGIPEDIKELQKELDKVSLSFTSMGIITVYSGIVEIFNSIQDSKSIHSDAKRFYGTKKREIESMSFANTPTLNKLQNPFAASICQTFPGFHLYQPESSTTTYASLIQHSHGVSMYSGSSNGYDDASCFHSLAATHQNQEETEKVITGITSNMTKLNDYPFIDSPHSWLYPGASASQSQPREEQNSTENFIKISSHPFSQFGKANKLAIKPLANESKSPRSGANTFVYT